MTSKKYGLILSENPKNKQPTFQATRNVFGDDTDSDDESNKKPVLLKPSDNINRQSKITQEKAVLEDPTVYQYDEIYDSMTIKKEEKKEKNNDAKKPKYIENLIKAANKRKIENERRMERQIQKEREKEGEEFADKEVFVTSAYKKKLEEMRQEEEREKYEEYLESIGDVTKQKDLGGFYRHLYEQKLGKDKGNEVEDNDGKDVIEKPNLNISDTDKSQTVKKRNYRKRKSSADNDKLLSDGEIADSDEEINRCNLEEIRLSKKTKNSEENIDADSDFSIDESSDEDKNEEINDHKKQIPTDKEPFSKENVKDNDVKANNAESTQGESNSKSPVEKIDIWKKRTVGEVFEQALKRYYERKASRSY
ncbi:unnamed protein product [Parnassius mnemosyne]|uniref:Nuclear speckle splicing regulatory protein 1 N-terminal domain-containing protein n=1 Tax=Parnassius mnemosyne TaxID=213953 RepID=A0AAV1M4D3_9NEOP